MKEKTRWLRAQPKTYFLHLIYVMRILVFILIAFLMCFCEEDQMRYEDTGDCQAILDQLDRLASVLPENNFEVIGGRMQGDCLLIKVRYGGGCKDHDFLMSHVSLPHFSAYSGVLMLSHNSDGDLCKALITETVSFDLTSLQDPEQDMIRLLVKQNVADSDYLLLIDYFY